MLLADLGADVLKVESLSGDDTSKYFHLSIQSWLTHVKYFQGRGLHHLRLSIPMHQRILETCHLNLRIFFR